MNFHSTQFNCMNITLTNNELIKSKEMTIIANDWLGAINPDNSSEHSIIIKLIHKFSLNMIVWY